MIKFISLLMFILMILGCSDVADKAKKTTSDKIAEAIVDNKPSFVGDEKAVALANEILAASGGQEAWDQTNYLQWNFFGSRKHIWNKATGDLMVSI